MPFNNLVAEALGITVIHGVRHAAAAIALFIRTVAETPDRGNSECNLIDGREDVHFITHDADENAGYRSEQWHCTLLMYQSHDDFLISI